MSESNLAYVVYYIKHPQKALRHPVHTEPGLQDFSLAHQEQELQNYWQTLHPDAEIVGQFTEVIESRKPQRWPELKTAIELCQKQAACLLIVELGVLTNNETFTQTLLNGHVPFYCLDQSFVDKTILEALCKHAQVQKKLHGKLIREGLKKTSAKSGNPNAAEVISKVNKPKIDTAITFAFVLQPIASDYKRKGFSQRHMVKSLNEAGFTAPEGGKWVLSQLQKVLDRVRLNELAVEFQPILAELESRNLSPQQMTEELNARSVPSPKRGPWDESQLAKLIERVQQIQDIVAINQFVLHLLPLIHSYKAQGLTETEMLKELEEAGLPIQKQAEDALVAA